MRKVAFILATGAFMWGLGLGSAQAVTFGLFEYAFNIDGFVYEGDSTPINVNKGAFDATTGLGVVDVTISGLGAHYVASFFDLEIDEASNTYFNEYGSFSGSPATGQSWELDEPGYVFGDIYANFLIGDLDNSNGFPGSPDDVSMAMGWNFILDADETAKITFSISAAMPTSGFFLTQTDPDSQESLYFSSLMSINNGEPVPEPSTLFLIGTGLAVLASRCRRKAN